MHPPCFAESPGCACNAEPLPEAECSEGSNCSGISVFWSEGCSSLGGAAGLRWGFSWCPEDMSHSGRADPCFSPVTALRAAGTHSLVNASSDIQELSSGLEVSRHPVWGLTGASSLEAHDELLFVPVLCPPCLELLFLAPRRAVTPESSSAACSHLPLWLPTLSTWEMKSPHCQLCFGPFGWF